MLVYRSGRIEWEESNKHLFLVSEEEERKNEAYSVSEYLMAENFPESM